MYLLRYQNHEIAYRVYGSGPKPLIFLHGFGDSSALIEGQTQFLQAHFTIYALDLPFHGKTNWQNDHYRPQDLLALIEELGSREAWSSFHLAGYSMGGHLALFLCPLLGAKVEALYLFGPGGLHYNLSYNRWLFNRPVRRFWRQTLQKPQRLQNLFDLALRLRLVHSSLHRFFSRQLQDPIQRDRMLNSWVSLYDFPLNKRHLRAYFRANPSCKVYFFYGKQDQITPLKAARNFARGLPQCQILSFDSNHFMFRNGSLFQFIQKACMDFRP